MNVFVDISGKPVHTTSHARQRIVQRYRLFMFGIEKDNPDLFIKKEFRTAVRDPAVHMSPFKEAVQKVKYGRYSEIWTNGKFRFSVSNEPEKVVIKSIFLV